MIRKRSRRMLAKYLVLLPLCLTETGCQQIAAALAPNQLNRSALEPSFADEFDQPPSFWDPVANPTGRWKVNYFHSVQDANAPEGWKSRTLEPNGELQYYGDPAIGMGAFSWSQGILTIEARPNPYRDDPRTHHLPYLSGLITTERSFNQRYGYFEARLALPMAKGVWPAFWLLPEPHFVNGWAQSPGQQEVDIVESIGEQDRFYLTHFTDEGGRKQIDESGRIYYTNADLRQFHVYGVLVTPSRITWYFDDKQVRQRPNVDFNRPAYMLLNLAIGGDWPGSPDSTTSFPARMQIDWVRAYRLKVSDPK